MRPGVRLTRVYPARQATGWTPQRRGGQAVDRQDRVWAEAPCGAVSPPSRSRPERRRTPTARFIARSTSGPARGRSASRRRRWGIKPHRNRCGGLRAARALDQGERRGRAQPESNGHRDRSRAPALGWARPPHPALPAMEQGDAERVGLGAADLCARRRRPQSGRPRRGRARTRDRNPAAGAWRMRRVSRTGRARRPRRGARDFRSRTGIPPSTPGDHCRERAGPPRP